MTNPVYNQGLNISLHGPGPSDTPPEVLKALATPTVGHLDVKFMEIMDSTQQMLRSVFQTKNKMTLPVSGTGSAGMETLIANIVEPNDKILVVVNGVFGARIADCIERYNGTATTIDLEWGTTASLNQIKEAFSKEKYNALFLVHAETSTGALQKNMKEIAEIVHKNNALFLVDCVTSLGGTEVKIDEWGIDAAYSGTQKCLSVPPGLSPITLNEKAMEKIRNRKTKIQSWYFDLSMIEKYWEESTQRVYHHTAPINMVYALHEGLRLILEEGLEQRFKRHKENAAHLQNTLLNLGFEYIVKDENQRLPMLHAVYLPKGLDEGLLRKELREKHNIEVGGGLGKFAGKAWRIGIMGYSSSRSKVEALLSSIKNSL